MADLKIFANTIEEKAREQINTLIGLEAFKDSKVRIMPDVHAGAGCVIGFTADLGDKVIPNIVGVDIGCGMLTVFLGKIDVNLKILDEIINKSIPSGMNVRTAELEAVKQCELAELYCFSKLHNIERIRNSVGTLGGGNHFIEIDVDEENNKYLVIHSGSRNLGKQVAEYYQSVAIEQCNNKNDDIKQLIQEYKQQGREKEIQEAITKLKSEKPKIPKELCYLQGEMAEHYKHDMGICQRYAHINRTQIAEIILVHLGIYLNKEMIKNTFTTMHNYIDLDNNIVRKGSISANKGEMVLIPMNMRDGCILGIGKGNEDWNSSAPHGAGRIMSRNQAKNTLSLQDYQNSMNGIYTTSVCKETIDEAPQVYKPIDEITELIKPTVDIVKILKPIYNFKAKEG